MGDDDDRMIELIEQLSPTTRRVLRAALGVMIAIALGFATLALFFVGSIEITGCFISCGDPNVLGGSLFLAGSAVTTGLLFVALGWGAGMNGRARLLKTFAIGSGLVTLLLLAVVSFN